MTPRVAILLSGRGTNFRVLAENARTGKLACEIALVFSNVPTAAGLQHAADLGLPHASISSAGVERTAFDRQVAELLHSHRIDWICLAGYMRLLSGQFVAEFPGRILNIHPSLLPAFPGLDAQHQALVHGVKITGCTVHLVDEHLDSGPIVMQAPVPVLDDDTVETLSARILIEEHRIYSEALSWMLSGQYSVQQRRILRTC